jgi:hypothetical protein
MSIDIIDEAQEAIKQERFYANVRRLAPYVIIIALAIILFTGIKVWMDNRNKAIAQNLTEVLANIINNVSDNDTVEISKNLQGATDGDIGALIKLKLAANLNKTNKYDEALAIYTEITSKHAGLKPEIVELANIGKLVTLINAGKHQEVEGYLVQPKEHKVFKYYVENVVASYLIEKGKYKDAIGRLEAVVSSNDVDPHTIKLANILLSLAKNKE